MVVKPIINLATKYTDDIVGFSVKAVLAPLKARSFEIEVKDNEIIVKGDTYKSCQQGISLQASFRVVQGTMFQRCSCARIRMLRCFLCRQLLSFAVQLQAMAGLTIVWR